MAHLAQSVTKYLYLFLTTGLLIWSCDQSHESAPDDRSIPYLEVEVSDAHFYRSGGILYHDSVPFSGHLIAFHTSGERASSTPYYKGREEGWAQGWHPDGSTAWKRLFQNGKKQGEHQGWYSNGQVRFLAHYTDDRYEGNVKEWYPDGQLFKDFNYQNGQEKGSQKLWKSDGRVKANYVVRNGRRYGLTGLKNCNSVYEEVQP